MTRYLLMKIESWEGFDTAPGPFQHLPIQVRPPAGCVGFCMVFDSREAALEWGGEGAQVLLVVPRAELEAEGKPE